MNFSFWEQDSWFSDVDFTIIGSGITGLNCALELKNKFPTAKILILEGGLLPNGASTKNAGFACFGSLSEILDDLRTHSEAQVIELIEKRVKGLEMLRKNLGDKNIDFQLNGGYELFTREDTNLFTECISRIPEINRLIKPIFGQDVFKVKRNDFGFKGIQQELIFNRFEGQLDTGKMMTALLQKVQSRGVKILNNIKVTSFSEMNTSVEVITDKFAVKTGNLFIATNGFASQLGISEVKPARAQVLITKPVKNLQIKGTFHLDKGYYYFRNVNNRILLGGGRNLDFKAEETTRLQVTEVIQEKLERLLRETILPEIDISIDYRWSGIMGVGTQKNPVVKQVSKNVFCGVRLGGMGVAIGSQVGRELANFIE